MWLQLGQSRGIRLRAGLSLLAWLRKHTQGGINCKLNSSRELNFEVQQQLKFRSSFERILSRSCQPVQRISPHSFQHDTSWQFDNVLFMPTVDLQSFDWQHRGVRAMPSLE
jgi:hypothetical protein